MSLRKGTIILSSLTCLLLQFVISFASPQLSEEALAKREQLEFASHHNNVSELHRIESYFADLGLTETDNPWAPYYASLAAYRLANLLGGARDSARTSLQNAIDHIEIALERSSDEAEILSLAGGCYGRMIGFSGMKAMSYGPKSSRLHQRALKLDPNNPRVLLFSAIDLFYKPGLFGGEKEKALQRTRQAALGYSVYENREISQPTWGHPDAFAWTGFIHQELGEVDQAEMAYGKGLEINPEYGWIKHVLLPKLIQQKTE